MIGRGEGGEGWEDRARKIRIAPEKGRAEIDGVRINTVLDGRLYLQT
jgi:hypothetical protein